MPKLSLSDRLVRFLKARPGVFVSGGELERIATQSTTYKPSTVSRRLRECAEDGRLARKEVKGTVYYAYIPQVRTVERVEVIGDRAILVKETIII